MPHCTRCRPYRPCLSHTVLPFGQYAGQTFDDVPLGYLDWLSGQPWMSYGPLRKRLSLYLTHPCIQRELDELFPDYEDDSRKPAFTVQGTYTRREPMPKGDDEPWDWRPTPMRPGRAWAIVADAFLVFESHQDDAAVPLLNWGELRKASTFVPQPIRDRLRSAFKAWQAKLEAQAQIHTVMLEAVAYFETFWASKLKRTPRNARLRIRRQSKSFRLTEAACCS